MPLDPTNPNVQAIGDLLDELNLEWIRKHTEAEDEAMRRYSEEQRRIRQQMFRPVPVSPPSESVEADRSE